MFLVQIYTLNAIKRILVASVCPEFWEKDDYDILGCNIFRIDGSSPTFQRNACPPFSGPKSKISKRHEKLGDKQR